MIGSLFRCTVQPAAERSAEASRQLERLLDLQVGQAFDLEDAAGEDVLLALLADRQQALP